MAERVKVKVRPGESLRLPASCVHCNQHASEQMQIRQKSGQTTRIFELPLCVDCYRDLNRKSGEEERLQRISLVAASIASLATLAAVFFFLFTGFSSWVRLLGALFFAVIVFAGTMLVFRRLSMRAILPEKRKVIDSAQMVDFSWRATTFEFSNNDFADRFGQLNEDRLME